MCKINLPDPELLGRFLFWWDLGTAIRHELAREAAPAEGQGSRGAERYQEEKGLFFVWEMNHYREGLVEGA